LFLEFWRQRLLAYDKARARVSGYALGRGLGMVYLDILGRVVVAPASVVAQLRDLAAERAGVSMSQRDLSLALERALHARSVVVLQRGEARALLELVGEQAGNAEIATLAKTLRTAL
jgi:hypothetical protein